MNKHDFNSDAVVWNLIEKFMKTPVDISPIIQTYFKASEVDNNIAYSIISLYPQFVNENILSKLLILKESAYFPFSWWYEIFTSQQKELSELRIRVLNQLDNIKNKNAIDCYEYLEVIKGKDSILDLIGKDNNEKNRELFSLEIISQLLDDWTKPIDLFTINNDGITTRGESFPYNFIIKKDKYRANTLEKIYSPKIIDERYFPNFINFRDRDNLERKFVFGIGILLFQLITKTKILPNYMYLPSYQLLNTGKFQSDLEKHPVSSLTTEIINSCLSKRGRETQQLIKDGEGKPEDAKH